MVDVAALAGVSPSAISNFFHRPHLVSADAATRIRSAIEELGYVPNESARRLRSGNSKTMALMLLDAWIPFYADLSRGVEDVADANGWAVLFSNTGRDDYREKRNLRLFEAQGVGGVLVVPQGDIGAELSELRRRGVACVTIERSMRDQDIPSVGVDDRTGGRIGAQHLLERGRRRIAFLGDPATVVHVEERWRGVLDAVGSDNEASARLIPIPTLTMDGGLRATQELLDSPHADWPDAIFGANDLVALGALQACLGAGVRVPEDLAIMGYDDIGFAAQAAVPLTTVRQPAYELGRVAAEILLADAGAGPDVARHVTFTPELIVRASA